MAYWTKLLGIID